MTITSKPTVGFLDRDLAADSASFAAPFGLRASKISTTRGRPCVMSAPATPPVWNAHRQLRARLADRLGGDDADRAADLAHFTRGEERVARLADAELTGT